MFLSLGSFFSVWICGGFACVFLVFLAGRELSEVRIRGVYRTLGPLRVIVTGMCYTLAALGVWIAGMFHAMGTLRKFEC